ncbi:MAG: VWA domain-containing protein [Deltaproteobacteria bacterium]|nr:MAG: VWA domain-containing protein [Deltaproteobacteria bacterium]
MLIPLALALGLATAPEPPAAEAWGTLTGGLHLEPAKLAELRRLIENYGESGRRQGLLDQLPARTGAHPVHQFIVQQAHKLVALDPAAKDPIAAFPDVRAINAWDGVERCEHGMAPTVGTGLVHDAPDLTPVLGPGAGGPGPDSELAFPMGNPFAPGGVVSATLGAGGGMPGLEGTLAGLGYNPFYNGRAHYFSPFLFDGAAPKQAAANYSRLAVALGAGVRGPVLPHYAAYMAHYISDPTSAKHADAFTLDAATVQAMIRHADAWVAAHTDDVEDWLATQPITDAVATLRARTQALNAGNSAGYWARVERHIANVGGTPLFSRDGYWVWMAPSTVRTAVACYLRELANRPAGRSLDQFYTYFDPFYFNGPIMQVKQDWTLATYDPPSFEACTPFSEHLFWETNPAQGALVREWTGKADPWLGGGDPRGKYVDWAPRAGFFELDEEVSRKAMEETMAALVRNCARTAHGGFDDARDWQPGFEDHLRIGIRCVATAFRASITALRAESWGRRVERGADIRIQLSVTSAGGVPGKLHAARVGILDAATGKVTTRPGWSFSLGDRAIGAEPTDVGVLVQGVPEGVAPTDLVVDLRADFGKLPDSGRARIAVEERGTRTVRNPSGGTLSAPKGPVDVIVVMDTTGSMGSSLASLRKNAIESIKKLRAKSTDLRLAVVEFRDLKEESDRAHFVVKPFSRDLESQFAFLNGLRPGGGGDTPEDQLHAVSLGINLWEREEADPDRVPTKIIVVVTDAPAKSPDSMGNTFATIAKRAEEVDPAHIYPIVVGNDPGAHAHGEELAKLTGGRILSTSSGDEVANALISAVDDAVVSYAAPVAGGGTRWALVVVALALLAIAGVLAWLAVRAGRARAQALGGL